MDELNVFKSSDVCVPLNAAAAWLRFVCAVADCSVQSINLLLLQLIITKLVS